MSATEELKQLAITKIKSLNCNDLHQLTRWCFMWVLTQKDLPGVAADDSGEATLEVVRQASMYRIAQICRWSALGRDTMVGERSLSRKVAALAEVVINLSDHSEHMDGCVAVDAYYRDYSPARRGRKTYEEGTKISGIVL
jgi:hypothetical protein